MVYWEAMERSASAGGADFSLPPVLEYNKLFDILGRAKLWPRLRAAYDRMRADGVKPNKASYQVLAHSAAVAAPWPEVLRVLDDAMAEGLGTNYVFTMALKGLKVRRNWKAASTLIGAFLRGGVGATRGRGSGSRLACRRRCRRELALNLHAPPFPQHTHPRADARPLGHQAGHGHLHGRHLGLRARG